MLLSILTAITMQHLTVSHAKRLYEWANEPKQLLIFEWDNHNTILAVNEEEYFNVVAHFVTTC